MQRTNCPGLHYSVCASRRAAGYDLKWQKLPADRRHRQIGGSRRRRRRQVSLAVLQNRPRRTPASCLAFSISQRALGLRRPSAPRPRAQCWPARRPTFHAGDGSALADHLSTTAAGQQVRRRRPCSCRLLLAAGAVFLAPLPVRDQISTFRHAERMPRRSLCCRRLVRRLPPAPPAACCCQVATPRCRSSPFPAVPPGSSPWWACSCRRQRV